MMRTNPLKICRISRDLPVGQYDFHHFAIQGHLLPGRICEDSDHDKCLVLAGKVRVVLQGFAILADTPPVCCKTKFACTLMTNIGHRVHGEIAVAAAE